MNENQLSPLVIVITGPCGAGKTTISSLVAKKFNIQCLRGDDLMEELFPGLTDITKHPIELKALKSELLKRAISAYKSGKSVIVDYIVLGSYIEEYQQEFGDDLIFKVILPSKETLISRDSNRECWTAGLGHINEQGSKFRRDEKLIGSQNFIDNTDESAQETLENHFGFLSL